MPAEPQLKVYATDTEFLTILSPCSQLVPAGDTDYTWNFCDCYKEKLHLLALLPPHPEVQNKSWGFLADKSQGEHVSRHSGTFSSGSRQ